MIIIILYMGIEEEPEQRYLGVWLYLVILITFKILFLSFETHVRLLLNFFQHVFYLLVGHVFIKWWNYLKVNNS